LALLDQELYEVVEWFSLGLHLDVPPEELKHIEYEPRLQNIQQRRIEMLTTRMKKLPKLSWSHTVTALMAVKRESLAQKIALKYGKSTVYTVQ